MHKPPRKPSRLRSEKEFIACISLEKYIKAQTKFPRLVINIFISFILYWVFPSVL